MFGLVSAKEYKKLQDEVDHWRSRYAEKAADADHWRSRYEKKDAEIREKINRVAADVDKLIVKTAGIRNFAEPATDLDQLYQMLLTFTPNKLALAVALSAMVNGKEGVAPAPVVSLVCAWCDAKGQEVSQVAIKLAHRATWEG